MTTDPTTTDHDNKTTASGGCCHTPGGHGIDPTNCHRCRGETPTQPTGRDHDHARISAEAVESAARAFYIADNSNPEWAARAWDDMGGSEPSAERADLLIAMEPAITAALPHLSPRPDAEVEQAAEIERLRAINDTLGELLRAAEPRVARATSQSHQSLGRLDALQAAVDVVIGDLNTLLDDCSQHGPDEENFVRVSAVREVLSTARLTTEQWDEALADVTPAPVPVDDREALFELLFAHQVIPKFDGSLSAHHCVTGCGDMNGGPNSPDNVRHIVDVLIEAGYVKGGQA